MSGQLATLGLAGRESSGQNIHRADCDSAEYLVFGEEGRADANFRGNKNSHARIFSQVDGEFLTNERKIAEFS